MTFLKQITRTQLPKEIQSLSRKKNAFLTVVPDGYTVEANDAAWEGGSRTEYSVMDIRTWRTRVCIINTNPFQEPTMIALQPHEILIEGGWFCGKPSGLRLKIQRSDVPAFCGAMFPRGMEWKLDVDFGIIADWLQEHSQEDAANKLRGWFC